MNAKFSVVTPVHVWSEDRREQLYRAIESLKKQTYKNFELIIVNDGSTLDVEIPKLDWIKVFNQPHKERIIAYNLGFENTTGNWITLLDSDDEYDPKYLEECANLIIKYPEYRMFNFGCKYIHKDGGTNQRGAFRPKRSNVGHEIFGGGNIVNGTFIWHKSVYESLGAYPPEAITDIDCSDINYGGIRDLSMCSPYDFSAYAQIEFPELRRYFMVKHPDHPKDLPKELGNPWGQDFYLFYKYTRKYHCKPVEKYLYIVHPR